MGFIFGERDSTLVANSGDAEARTREEELDRHQLELIRYSSHSLRDLAISCLLLSMFAFGGYLAFSLSDASRIACPVPCWLGEYPLLATGMVLLVFGLLGCWKASQQERTARALELRPIA